MPVVGLAMGGNMHAYFTSISATWNTFHVVRPSPRHVPHTLTGAPVYPSRLASRVSLAISLHLIINLITILN